MKIEFLHAQSFCLCLIDQIFQSILHAIINPDIDMRKLNFHLQYLLLYFNQYFLPRSHFLKFTLI